MLIQSLKGLTVLTRNSENSLTDSFSEIDACGKMVPFQTYVLMYYFVALKATYYRNNCNNLQTNWLFT